MTLRHMVVEDAIPLDVCEYIKNFFDTHIALYVRKPNNPDVIKINSPWTHLNDVLDPIFSKYFVTNNGQGGNIYKHSNLYTTHVDSGEPWQLINCLLPIYLHEPAAPQHFVVFDQWVDNGFGQTWYGDRVDTIANYDFDFNKKTIIKSKKSDLILILAGGSTWGIVQIFIYIIINQKIICTR